MFISRKLHKKLLFVGDPHLDSVTPISRAENYRDITIDKLEQLLQICIKNKIDLVVFAGDMFTNLDQSLIYMNKVIDVLTKFKASSISLTTIVGNHDLPRNSMELFKNSPLYTLTSSGLIDRLGIIPLELNETVRIYGLDYTDKESLDLIKPDKNYKNIIVAHYATENTIPVDNIPKEKFEEFDVVLLGHDHHPYEPFSYKNTMFYRPGNLTRMTREKFNLERDIVVLEFDLQTNHLKATEHKLEISKPDVAFKSEVFNEGIIDYYTGTYGDLFNDEYFESGGTTLKEIIEELPETILDENKEYYKKELVVDET